MSAPIPRRTLLGAAAVGSVAILSGCAERVEGVAGDGIGVVAAPARRFINSVGINAHWTYGDTSYVEDYDEVVDRLVELGVRHVRGELNRARALARRGIKTTLLVDSAMDGSGTPYGRLQDAREAARNGYISALEGPNEPDLFWVKGNRSYRSESFPGGVVRWQQDLYRLARSDDAFRGVRVIGPSLGRNYATAGNPFAARSLEQFVDFGNFHPYAAGNPFNPPRPYAGVERYYWNSNFPSIGLDEYPVNFRTYRPPFGNKSMVATEAGYSSWRLGSSELAKAKYTPRIFLENFRLGIRRTYLYQLADEAPDPTGGDRERHFGLLRADLTPTPAYRRLRSLLRACKPIPSGGPRGDTVLPLHISASAPEGYRRRFLHHVVLRRGPSDAVVLLWHEVSAEDTSPTQSKPPSAARQLTHPEFEVSLRWKGGPVTFRAMRIDGQVDRPPIGSVVRLGLNLAVGDDVVVVHIHAQKGSLV